MPILDNRAKFIEFCKLYSIYYDVYFANDVFTDSESRNTFDKNYYMLSHLKKALPEQEDTVILVLETLIPPNIHGKVVASIAERVAKKLSNSIQTLYVGASINPSYRKLHELETDETISNFMRSQSAQVINTSIGWHDISLDFNTLSTKRSDGLHEMESYIIDSAGNDGKLGGEKDKGVVYKKHNEVSIVPRYVMSVGAASKRNDGTITVDGYSSANSPSFLGLVSPETKIRWNLEKDKEAVIGTSAAAPYASGIIAALHRRFGSYLHKEHIVWAVMASCDKVDKVSKFNRKTNEEKQLSYITNARGLEYNSEYAGFGLINVDKAYNLLTHLVNESQKDLSKLTKIEEQVFETKNPKNIDNKNEYIITMGEGTALKTVLSIEFEKEYGNVKLVSPSGTEFPIVLSRLLVDKTKKSAVKEFGSAMTHAFTGEKTLGEWRVISTEPISALSLSCQKFQTKDIVNDIDIAKCVAEKVVDLKKAKSLRQTELEINFGKNLDKRTHSGITIAGVIPNLKDDNEIVSLLYYAPEAIDFRTSKHEELSYPIIDSGGGKFELLAYKYSNNFYNSNNKFETTLSSYNNFIKAAELYQKENKLIEEANCYSLAALEIGKLEKKDYTKTYVITDLAVDALQKAIKSHLKSENYHFAYRDIDRLYEFLNQSINQYKEKGDNKKVDSLLKLADDIQYQTYKISKLKQGMADYEAERIEQGEMGFVNSKDKKGNHITPIKIGTDSVSQCLIVMAKDEKSGLVGLCHYHYGTNVESLNNFLSKFPNENGALKVRLLGSRFIRDDISKQNMVDVIKFMAKSERDIDIISADVFASKQTPSSVVVDPATFEIFELVPMKHNQNNFLSNAKIFIQNVGKSLKLKEQFDFSINHDRKPVFISRDNLKQYNEKFANKDSNDIYSTLKNLGYYDIGLVSLYANSLGIEIDRVQTELLNNLRLKVFELQNNGFNIDEKEIKRAEKTLLNKQIWIGENSEHSNQPLINAVRGDKIFKISGNKAIFNQLAIIDIDLAHPDSNNVTQINKSPKLKIHNIEK